MEIDADVMVARGGQAGGNATVSATASAPVSASVSAPASVSVSASASAVATAPAGGEGTEKDTTHCIMGACHTVPTKRVRRWSKF